MTVTARVQRGNFTHLSGYAPVGWLGETSTGRRAYLRDGQAWWFAEDPENGRLTDAEQNALDRAAMEALKAARCECGAPTDEKGCVVDCDAGKGK